MSTPGNAVKNVLNSDVEIKGNIKFAGELTFDGKLDGEIHTDGTLNLGDSAVINGHINVTNVVVRGKVNGNIECGDRLDIRSEGSVTGDVSTVRISVEDGAVLKGGIQVRSAESKPEKHPTNSQIKPAETSKPSASEPPKALAAKSGA